MRAGVFFLVLPVQFLCSSEVSLCCCRVGNQWVLSCVLGDTDTALLHLITSLIQFVWNIWCCPASQVVLFLRFLPKTMEKNGSSLNGFKGPERLIFNQLAHEHKNSFGYFTWGFNYCFVLSLQHFKSKGVGLFASTLTSDVKPALRVLMKEMSSFDC